jgi:DNA-binding PadR family transcriptional regulator
LQLVERSHGALKRGTVYVTLGRMQEKGYVESRTQPPAPGAIGLPRRLYRPTAYGAGVFRAWNRAARAIARLQPHEA